MSFKPILTAETSASRVSNINYIHWTSSTNNNWEWGAFLVGIFLNLYFKMLRLSGGCCWIWRYTTTKSSHINDNETETIFIARSCSQIKISFLLSFRKCFLGFLSRLENYMGAWMKTPQFFEDNMTQLWSWKTNWRTF